MTNNFPYKVLDLTHKIDNDTKSWHGSCGFTQNTTVEYDDCTTDVKFRIQEINMHAGVGTHIDAPGHIIRGGAMVGDFELESLVRPCIRIDASNGVNANSQLSADDILVFEKEYGKVQDGSFFLVCTSWDRHWSDPEKYQNKLQFPSVTEDAALLLLERNIAGLGIDTMSPDCPASGYPVHKHLLGAGKYIVENITNAKSLPPVGSFSMSLPINGRNLTEAPVRLVGLIKH
ncbi:MAG: cyclase family protein [Rickettsiaceae bacterium]